MPNLRIKRNPPDTFYIKTYPNFLSAGVHLLSPAIRRDMTPRMAAGGKDAASKLRANVSDIMGFAASYRFISAGFAFLLKSGMNMHPDYAPSQYRTATVKYSSAAFSFQFKYLRLKGFTDVNTANHPGENYRFTLRPDLLNKEFQFEGLYNFGWRKYSYIAPLTFAQRQIRSRAGFLLKGGVYYNQLSGDTTLFNVWQQQQYPAFTDIKALRSFSIKLAPGLGGNLVFYKRIYFSFATFVSYDLFLYKYLRSPDERVRARSAGAFNLDTKLGLGYQSRRLYAGVRYELEYRTAALRQDLLLTGSNAFAGIEVGYRFDAPEIVKKIYRKTMPPGM